jgi:hypothetical protein
MSWQDMKAHIGRPVVVTLNEHSDPPVTVTGVLVGLEDDGEFVIDTANGRRYCWPAVDMADADEVTT